MWILGACLLLCLTQPALAQKDWSPPLKQTLSKLESWTLVLKDLNTGQLSGYHRDQWNAPSIPASTYKVPHSLIGLDSGVISQETVFPWNGKTHDLKSWNQDHTLKSAFQSSCVPCYQQLAHKIGVTRMQTYLNQLKFGHMHVTHRGLDTFWLTGRSRISPLEQVHFQSRLALGKLPIKPEVQDAVKGIMADPEWVGLHGKTGWGRVPHVDFGNSRPGQRHYGWYVGFYKDAKHHVAFASRLKAKTPVPSNFVAHRKQLVVEGLQKMGITLKKRAP